MDEKELLEKLNSGFDELSKMEESDVLEDFGFDIFDRMKRNAQDAKKDDAQSEEGVGAEFDVAKKQISEESKKILAEHEATAKEIEDSIEEEKRRKALQTERLLEQLKQERLEAERKAEETLIKVEAQAAKTAELELRETQIAERKLREELIAQEEATQVISRQAAKRLEAEQKARERKEKEKLEVLARSGKDFFKNIKSSIEDAVKEDRERIAKEKQAKAEAEAIVKATVAKVVGEIDEAFNQPKHEQKPKQEIATRSARHRRKPKIDIKATLQAFALWAKHNRQVYRLSWKIIIAEQKEAKKERKIAHKNRLATCKTRSERKDTPAIIRRISHAYYTWAIVWDQIDEEKFLRKLDKKSAARNRQTQKLNAKKIRENQCNENIGSEEN